MMGLRKKTRRCCKDFLARNATENEVLVLQVSKINQTCLRVDEVLKSEAIETEDNMLQMDLPSTSNPLRMEEENKPEQGRDKGGCDYFEAIKSGGNMLPPMGLSLISAFNPSGQEIILEPGEDSDYFARIDKELHIEILIRIPLGEVNLCKSVSRQWHQLISDPSFLVAHRIGNISLLGFFYNNASFRVKFFPLAPTKDYFAPFYNIVQQQVSPWSTWNSWFVTLCSSNGLVLLLDRYEEIFFLYDPITGQILRLPRPPLIDYEGLLPRIHRPQRRFIVYGLAFVLLPNDRPYFLLVEVIDDGKLDLRVDSFSSITCRWESQVHNVANFLPEGYTLLRQSTFLNNSLHWLVEPSGILAYNINTKCFSFLPIPDDQVVESCKCRRPAIIRCLGDSQEHLIYVRVTGDIEFSIWNLDDYHRMKWSVRHHIVINNNLPRPPGAIARVLAFDPRNSQVMFIGLARKIYSCDLIKREMKEIHNIPDGEGQISFIMPYKLPRSYPSASPKCCFSLLFGDSICYKGTSRRCIPREREDLVKLNPHVHETDNNGMRSKLPLSTRPHVREMYNNGMWSKLPPNTSSCDDYFANRTNMPRAGFVLDWWVYSEAPAFHSKTYCASRVMEDAA